MEPWEVAMLLQRYEERAQQEWVNPICSHQKEAFQEGYRTAINDLRQKIEEYEQ